MWLSIIIHTVNIIIYKDVGLGVIYIYKTFDTFRHLE